MIERLETATAALDPPFAAVDMAAFAANAADLARRSAGKPIRLATKSVRCRGLMRAALAHGAFRGLLAFSLAEALWLAEEHDDIVVGYPTADRAGLRRLASSESFAHRVTLMVDSREQLALIDACLGASRLPLRVCIDVDASLRFLGGRLHIGTRRSPVHSVAAAVALAEEIVADPRYRLVGLMAYEAQVAGLGDDPVGRPLRGAAIRMMKAASRRELRERRAAVVASVRSLVPLSFVNGGGTGSLETTAGEAAVTETCAGSGLLGPGAFDHYRAFRPTPAAFFALSVVRKPTPDIVTLEGGGWIASGPPGRDRLPVIAHPAGLSYLADECAGEVQTPLRGFGARGLRIGDRVWLRHAKSGEVCEHVNVLHLVHANGNVDEAPTYRGEGRVFL